jgi:hypothetical protein
VKGAVAPAWACAALALLLAGCADAGRPPDGLPVDADGDPLPTLHGFVVNGAIRPIAGAIVRFLGSEGAEATTDEGGRYEIRRPTQQAEDVLVTAWKQGFVALTHQVKVSGHRSAEMDFVLAPDPFLVPHVTVLQHRGTLRCDAAVAVGGQADGVGCDADHRVDDTVPPWIWEVNPTPNLAGAVVEVHWEPMTPLASNLHAWLRAPMVGGQGGELVAEATGPSPLRLEVPAEQARSLGRWAAITLYVDLGDGATPGASVRDQSFDAFASLFYVDPAPPGYVLS